MIPINRDSRQLSPTRGERAHVVTSIDTADDRFECDSTGTDRYLTRNKRWHYNDLHFSFPWGTADRGREPDLEEEPAVEAFG